MNAPRLLTTTIGVLMLGLGTTAGADDEATDWRLELLEAEGIGTTEEALKKAFEGDNPVPEDLQDAYRRLAAEEFAAREAAQKELIQGGDATAERLKKLERSDNPEVRRRVDEILRTLGTDDGEARDLAIQHAIRSLLAEGKKRRADTGGLFYEWFGEEAPKLEDGYRLFRFENPVQRKGWVTKERLHFSGEGRMDGDQQLVLPAKHWPGREEFGAEFQVTAKLGGEDNGAGAWHLGLSIGNVRALYHPGLNGGGFRFEEVDDNSDLSGNTSVGFNPSSEHLQWMQVKARRLAGGKVRLDVTLKSGGDTPKRFDQSITVTAGQIGKLDRIGLDRSGRTGGTAHFEDLTVRIIRP